MSEQTSSVTTGSEQEEGQKLSTADLASTNTNATAAAGQGETEVETRPTGAAAQEEQPTPLFPENETGDFRSRWTDIQAAFVDDPRSAVEQADNLVAEVMKRLATLFSDERRQLEGQWEQGEDVSTEDLRVALRRYRSFFDRLLSV